jgi:UDP-2-acetamido-2,6-beta-L-arabino-hexul-4-ose reductase
MKTVVVTGATGFIGLNLRQALTREPGWRVRCHARESGRDALQSELRNADVVCHLETVYRSDHEADFEDINVGETSALLDLLDRVGRTPAIIYVSSVQAGGDSPYGRSKQRAEELLSRYGERTGAAVTIFRLHNEFGKWCRPDDCSVVATFCHRIARDLDIDVVDPDRVLELVYIDDIVAAISDAIRAPGTGTAMRYVEPVFRISVGDLAGRLHAFRASRESLLIPDLSDRLTRCLYATYLSHLDLADFTYSLPSSQDARGALGEYFKSRSFGQVFVSHTRAGITRGNHYHDTKVEKFCVLHGEAVIRFRHLVTDQRVEYRVAGDDFKVVDIPPGFSHSIENSGGDDLVVLFWSSEVFNALLPDTHPREVLDA